MDLEYNLPNETEYITYHTRLIFTISEILKTYSTLPCKFISNAELLLWKFYHDQMDKYITCILYSRRYIHLRDDTALLVPPVKRIMPINFSKALQNLLRANMKLYANILNQTNVDSLKNIVSRHIIDKMILGECMAPTCIDRKSIEYIIKSYKHNTIYQLHPKRLGYISGKLFLASDMTLDKIKTELQARQIIISSKNTRTDRNMIKEFRNEMGFYFPSIAGLDKLTSIYF